MASTSNLAQGEGLKDKDLEGTSVKGSAFFCMDLWDEIEEDLGAVTDFELGTCESQHTPFVINYKSNGQPKQIYLSNYKMVLQSLVYCIEHFSVIKKYKHSSLNPQHSL